MVYTFCVVQFEVKNIWYENENGIQEWKGFGFDLICLCMDLDMDCELIEWHKIYFNLLITTDKNVQLSNVSRGYWWYNEF